METKTRIFKNMNIQELTKNYTERKELLEVTQAEILECRQKMKTLRKRELLELEKLKTITHWLSSRWGKKISHKRI
jgi:hypothetical protein